MDKQQERSRMDEENTPNSGTDMTRNQNRQQTGEVNEGKNVSNDPARSEEGQSSADETERHKFGEFKTGNKPLPDNEDR